MKGSMFDLSETFVKILSISYFTVVLLGIFLAVNQYNLIYLENRVERETLITGNALLSADCLVERSYKYENRTIKCLLSTEKIINEIANMHETQSNISCLNFSKGIYVEILDENQNVLHRFGNFSVINSKYYTVFPAALNTTAGIIPVTLNVTVGV